jgi:hypothetical protein
MNPAPFLPKKEERARSKAGVGCGGLFIIAGLVGVAAAPSEPTVGIVLMVFGLVLGGLWWMRYQSVKK